MTPEPSPRISVMKPLCLVAGLCFAIAWTTACGGSGTAGDNASAGSSTPASTSASGSSSAAVPHEKLAALLPTIPGFKPEYEPRGTTDTTENVSRVQVDYIAEAGGMGLSVEMMDVSGSSIMLAPLKELLKLQGVRHSAAGTTEKATNVAGFPAVEEWTAEAGNGSVSVLVGDRFVVYYEPSLWRFWRHDDETFGAEPGDTLNVFFAIYSPTNFDDTVFVRWSLREPTGWQDSDRIAIHITGGREEGFRGFATKDNFSDGDWRVTIETRDGREISRLNFTVVRRDTNPGRVFRTRTY